MYFVFLCFCKNEINITNKKKKKEIGYIHWLDILISQVSNLKKGFEPVAWSLTSFCVA